ncbi:MAG: penicillin-binding protein 2 [Pseudomonadota bacterium]
MPLESYGRDMPSIKKRLRWGFVFVVLCFIILAGRLFYLQVIKSSEYHLKSEINIVRIRDIPTFRGIVKDSKGRIMAANKPAYQVYITPAFFNYERDYQRLCDFLDLSQGERDTLIEKLKGQNGLKAYQPYLVDDDISRDALALFETHRRNMAGVKVTCEPKRIYPMGRISAHAIGYLSTVRKEDIDDNPELNYKLNDKVGRFGIERAYEHILRGRRGWQKIVVNAKGVLLDALEMKKLVPGPFQKDPVPGQDIILSLDVDLMMHIDRLFRGYPSGSAVVIEVHSGRILAMYSKPSFNPNELSSGISRATLMEMNENPFHPWIDRTISAVFSPGSTFKIITALAALQEGIISPSDSVDCPGFMEIGNRTYKCTGQHGKVSLHKAIVFSCNVYFYNLALMVGIDRIAKYAKLLGMGDTTGIGINTELKGLVPDRDWYMNKRKVPFMPGYTINMSIGQGNLQTTLLQLAGSYAAIVNGGTIYRPTVIKRIELSDGSPVQRFFPEVVRTITIKENHFKVLRDGMVGVIEDPHGTASGLNLSNISVGGKTGTAQVPMRKRKKGEPLKDYWYFTRDHAWFVAFAPSEAPEVVAVILVEHGGVGGKTAAPIAVNTIVSYLKENY